MLPLEILDSFKLCTETDYVCGFDGLTVIFATAIVHTYVCIIMCLHFSLLGCIQGYLKLVQWEVWSPQFVFFVQSSKNANLIIQCANCMYAHCIEEYVQTYSTSDHTYCVVLPFYLMCTHSSGFTAVQCSLNCCVGVAGNGIKVYTFGA